MKRVVTLKLSQDEARSLEFEMDDVVRHLQQRNAIQHSPAADALIERYRAIGQKVREARNPEVETKHKAVVKA